jgi:hypothetical protein
MRWAEASVILSFDFEHAPVFFGRTRARNELRELLARREVARCAFVLVLGASGSGKSSLVKAALLPDLMLHGMIGRVALARWALLRSSDASADLVGGLAAALLGETALPELSALHYAQPELTALLREAPGRATPPLRQALGEAGKKAEIRLPGVISFRVRLSFLSAKLSNNCSKCALTTFCVPAGATLGQTVDVVVKFLRERVLVYRSQLGLQDRVEMPDAWSPRIGGLRGCPQCSAATLTPAIDDQSAPSFTPTVGTSVLSRSIWRTSATHLETGRCRSQDVFSTTFC